MVTWIFGHYHKVLEMHSECVYIYIYIYIRCMVCDLVTEDVNHKFFVNSKS